MEIVNGLIESASLEIEDHDVLTFMLYIKMDHGSQGFGGYAYSTSEIFEEDYDYRKIRHGEAMLATHICYLFDALNIRKWSQLNGLCIRVKYDDNKHFGRIEAIGHIIEDRWFDPKKIIKNIENKQYLDNALYDS